MRRQSQKRGCLPLVEIPSGVYEGKTTGTPIALLIGNVDQRSKDYAKIANSFRPGHADYTYLRKYGIRDSRRGGRSSARLTAPAVAAGAVAKKWLRERYGVEVRGYLSQLGPNKVDFKTWDDVNALRHRAQNLVVAERVSEIPARAQSNEGAT